MCGELLTLSKRNGYCFAQNAHFVEIYRVASRSVTRSIERLVNRGYFRVSYQGKGGGLRYVYPLISSDTGVIPPDCTVTPSDTGVTVPLTVVSATPDRSVIHKSKRSSKDKLFAQFWAAYPKRKDKIKAQKAFNKLNPDEALLAEILAALDWQKQSPDWLKNGGQFVPYAATYLNGRRWEDEPPQNEMPARQAASDLMWALDENGRKYAVERK